MRQPSKNSAHHVEPYFTRTGSGFEPLTSAVSGWSADMVVGPAILGLLARAAEERNSDEGFFATRLTADLFRPVRMARIDTNSHVVRWGHRIRVVDSALLQDGVVVARASVVFFPEVE